MKTVMKGMKSLVVMCAVAMLASCSKSTDLFDQDAVDAQKKADYAAKVEQMKLKYAQNFEKKYGKVDPDQSWDFTAGLELGTRGPGWGNVRDLSRTQEIKVDNLNDGLDFGVITKVTHSGKKTITVTKNTSIFNAIREVLPDNTQHNNVVPVTLTAPVSDFYIYPVSTQGSWTHELKVKVGNTNPITVYNKTWSNADYPYVNGMEPGNGHQKINMKGVHIQAPVGTPIEIYADNIGGNRNKKSGTFNGLATYVDVPSGTTITCPSPKNLAKGAVIKYIGIEDDSSANSDNDFNDIVLAVVGNPDVPGQTPVTTNEEYDVQTSICKRYMVEDLGTQDDFDFNDLVVDVYQNFTERHKKTFQDGELIKDEVISTTESSQEAIVRAMGGTLDFTITIGETSWSKSTGVRYSDNSKFDVGTMYNTQSGYLPNEILAKFTVVGWNPLSNNISITVAETQDHVYTIPFPKEGEIPMIVAVNANYKWNWMTEKKSVPAWWNDPNTVLTDEDE